MTGHYQYLVETRDAVLSTARISPEARARVLGRKYVYRPPPAAAPVAEPRKKRVKKRPGLGPRRGIPARALLVIAAFCRSFGVKIDDVFTPRRSRKFARPRQAAMYFLHKEMKWSQPATGATFKRDHTTVHHSWALVEILLVKDADFTAAYRRAERSIRRAWAEQ